MQRLTAMTLGAALIGFCGFVYDVASAQAPECPKHEAAVYFDKDSARLDQHQDYTLVRIAEAARSCGAKNVLVQSTGDSERAEAVAAALKQRGVKTTVVMLPALAPSGDTMLARSVVLRVADGDNAAG